MRSQKARQILLRSTVWAFFAVVLMILLPGETPAATKKLKSYEKFGKELSKMIDSNPVAVTAGVQSVNPYATKRLIIKVKNKKVRIKKYGAKQVISGPDNIYIMQFASISAAKKAEKQIRRTKGVVYVEPDRIVSVDSKKSDGLSLGSIGWGTQYTGLADFSKYVGTQTNRSIKVAVIDTGVSSHKLLKERLIPGKDMVSWKAGMRDTAGHGTHVAGIIADSTPGANVQIMPIRIGETGDDLSNSEIGAGINYAVELGAKVLNLSFGEYDRALYVEDQINLAVKKGCVVVVSAGNDEVDINKNEYCPAYMTNVITVGAIKSNGKRCGFSGYGKSLDVMAPGEGIESTSLNNRTKVEKGTSQATPYVTALAALYKLLYPNESPSAIKKRITSTVKDAGAKGWDKYYGYGIIQAPTQYTKISMNATSIAIGVGEQKSLDYTASNKYLSSEGAIWKSSNAGIVSVNKEGVITGKKLGKAKVSVTVYGKSVSCTVTVNGLSEKNRALKNYAEALADKKMLHDTVYHEGSYFALIYLDDNDIPELVVGDGNTIDLLGVNGKLLDAYHLFGVGRAEGGDALSCIYYPRKGLFCIKKPYRMNWNTNGWILDTEYGFSYLPKNGVECNEYALSRTDRKYSDGNAKTFYYRNDEMIEQNTYQTLLAKDTGKTLPVEVTFVKNTSANRKQYLA